LAAKKPGFIESAGLICCKVGSCDAAEFVIVLPRVSPVALWLRAFLVSRDAVNRSLFHRGSRLLTELARFPTAIRFRRGQVAELFPRVSLLYLAFLLSVKCRPSLRRAYLEKLFHVPCRRESRVDSLLLWHADSPILCRRAKPLPLATFQRPAIQLPQVMWLRPGSLFHLLLPPRLLPRLLLLLLRR
jgi:hypothetical protein